MFSSRPLAAIDTRRDDPPKEMNGRGTPVMGSSPMTMPMLRNAWAMNQPVMPMATSMLKRSAACRAVRKPYTPRARNRATTRTAPISPSSSPMMAKMKSVWASGR